MQAGFGRAGQAAISVFEVARHPVSRQIIALGIGLWFVWGLLGQFARVDPGMVFADVARISTLQWGVAGLLTFASFVAIAGYDIVIGRYLAPDARDKDLALSGFVATALVQLFGFGLATGSLARWRMLGGRISLTRATLMTATVTVSFIAAATVSLALAVLLSGRFAVVADVAAGVVLCLAMAVLAVTFWRPRLSKVLPGANFPGTLAVRNMIFLAALDTFFAAMAMYALMPVAVEVTPLHLFAVFLLALGAGLISGIPGGIGPFEVTFLALLPHQPEASVLSAILAFRIVYFLLPGVAAIVVLMRVELRDTVAPSRIARARFGPFNPSLTLPHVIAQATRAEAALLGQGSLGLLMSDDGKAALMVAQSGNSLIALADPLGAYSKRAGALAALKSQARSGNLQPVLYKCAQASAALAADHGFSCHIIGHEAVLDPVSFHLKGPDHRELRRKLAHCTKAGVTVLPHESDTLPLDEMARVAADWAKTHHGERGFSMAKFTPGHCDKYQFHLAWQGRCLLGFVGVWRGAAVHGVDLMRLSPDACDGVMHALIHSAVSKAADMGIRRFSLSSVPFLNFDRPASVTELCSSMIYRYRPQWHAAQGLYRFKNSFRPQWEPLFLCIPKGASGLMAGLDLHRAIKPDP